LDIDDLDPSLGTLSFELAKKSTFLDENGIETTSWEKELMLTERCTDRQKHFKDVEVTHLGNEFDKLTCIINKDYYLRGNFYAETFEYVELSVIPCGSKFDEQGNQLC